MKGIVMSEEQKVKIRKLQGHNCFACGTANPIGLNLKFYRLGDAVCSDITLGRSYEGWENLIHGGIISTLLDEVMSWTIIYFKKVFFVTRKMDVKYIKPVKVGMPLTVKGKLMDSSGSRKIEARGEILDDNGNLLVRSFGEFAVLPKEKLPFVPEGLKEDMLLLFEKI